MLRILQNILRVALSCCALLSLACSEGPRESSVNGTDSAREAALPAELPPLQERHRPRGLWVLCEGSQRVLEHPEKIQILLNDAAALGTTDLFVQVYRGGRAWFQSTRADARPYEKILLEHDQDTLAELIRQAHERGLRVHAWVNVLSLAGNRYAPILTDLGSDAVAVDRKGRSVLEYEKLELPEYPLIRMGTPAVWLDPAAPGVSTWLAETFRELMVNYPELDGLHFDYIRYPDVLPFAPGSRFGVGMDFGYGAATRARFTEETGKTAPFKDSQANANRWDNWRREQLRQLIREIKQAVETPPAETEEPKREILYSAAVLAYPERAYLSMFQDWRGWLDDDLLDFAVPMLYTLDDRLLRYEAAAYAGGVGGDRVWIGLGTWLFAKNPQRAIDQIEMVRDSGGYGDALFSWDSIADHPELRDALALQVIEENAQADAVTDGMTEAMDASVEHDTQ